MKRIQEKVKDLVEVRVYRSLQDFTTDPAQTLAAYHFADATSEMMAKWLDRLSGVQPQNGAACALAGYRGVGKSHFFAAFAAIAANPELRTKISDAHVAASAQQLKRRRYPVAFVRRGTRATLLEEIKDAVGKTFEVEAKTVSGDLNEIVKFLAAKSGDLPFVMLFDTAFERASRVARDDGIMLGELAEITANLNFFIAVALDDDIAGADGVNAAIARNYTIDYLDQEHLYRVVETNIFPKHRQVQHILRDIHENFREVLPGFRWSQQRFVSLYPVHPVILETAQFIRLYAPEFAFLGFASEAGNKVMGRPANSLVGLDEVFDRVENSLRKAEDLRDAFATYDGLNAEVIANVPVMQRLQAKLVLKALLILSLDGDGTTASEIAAAMLIYDETNRQQSNDNIESLLETFYAAFPEQVRRKAEHGKETLFSLKVSGKDNLNETLAQAATEVSDDVFETILRRFARERFADWKLHLDDQTLLNQTDAADCQVVWRGGHRRGRVVWNRQSSDVHSNNAHSNSENAREFIDWEVIVGMPSQNAAAEDGEIPTIFWQPAELSEEEQNTLRRYHVLLADNDLREMFGEQAQAAGQTYQKAVRKIWNRVYLENGTFTIDGAAHSFDAEAQTAQTLGELLTRMLTPLFESRYAQHPVFARALGINEVGTLVSEHFSGSKPTVPEAQELAQSFALPLGLVTAHGGSYILNSDEKRLSQPFVREVMRLVGESAGETVTLKNIYRELKKSPYGLVHEAVHLVLAALVAQRHVEFVTKNNDRINRRSLDLQIIWDDIIGVAAPTTVLYGSQKLTDWARTLTAADNFKTIDDPADREQIRLALENWLADWRLSKVLERFEELPAEILTTKIWRLSTQTQKTFGVVAQTIEFVLDDTISLEEGLQRIADAFSDSEQEFFRSTKDLVTLEDFINGAQRRENVWQYLAVCETTDDENIENLRAEILRVVDDLPFNPNEARNLELAELWQEFQAKFAEHFSSRHYAVMKSHDLQAKTDEILQSGEWWEFESLSRLPIFQRTHWNKSQTLLGRLGELNCAADVRELLKNYPFCACSFRLSQADEWESLPEALSETIERGRKAYRKTLLILSDTLTTLLEDFARTEKSEEVARAAANLAENISAGQIPLLDNHELVILSKVVQSMPSAPILQIPFPAEKGFLTREELRAELDEWLDELPSDPILLKI